MKRLSIVLAVALACAWPAAAQQPAPPAFAAPNLGEAGVRSMAATCASCHGTDGRTVSGSPIAPLAGKSREEITQAMTQYKEGKRPATLMHQIAKGYSEAEIAALAEFFSKQR